MALCQQLKDVSFSLFVTVILFSMATWLDVVGIWVELPLLVNVLPEGWGLPAYLTIIIQCANIGPATYALVYKFRSKSSSKRAYVRMQRTSLSGDVIVSFVILIVTALSIFCMCFVWEKTVFAAGMLRSIPLFSLVGVTALVSCMSSVVFLPYMARFSAVYITAYYIGQGLSGLVPGIVGLLQGIGQEPICVNSTIIVFNSSEQFNYTEVILKPYYKPPLFSVSAFFGFVASLLCVSLIAFYVLNFADFCKKHMVASVTVQETALKDESNEQATLPVNVEPCSSNDRQETSEPQTNVDEIRPETYENNLLKNEAGEESIETREESIVPKPPIKRSRFVLLLTTVGVINAMTNGILPATQSYTCLPFGSLVYTLSVRLSSVASPLASLSSMFLPRPSVRTVIFLTVLGVFVSMFHLTLAVQSPNPVLKGQVAGEVIVIISSVVMAASYSFVRVSVAAILREEGGKRELLWCGGITQVGSLCGAFVTFLLVQVFHVFKGVKPCS